MANTVQDNSREAWTYTDDAGNDYRVSAKTVYVTHGTDAAKYGGSQAAATVPRLPKGFRMRAVKCTSAGLPDQWIPVYDTTCALWATPGTTVTRNNAGVDATYTRSTKRRSERQEHDTTTEQS